MRSLQPSGQMNVARNNDLNPVTSLGSENILLPDTEMVSTYILLSTFEKHELMFEIDSVLSTLI